MFSNPLGGIRGPGLLMQQYQQPQYGGLLGGMNTQQLMQQYLQSLFMRRYQTPALMGAQNTVRSQLGPGGLTYQAPQPTAQALPGRQSLFGQAGGSSDAGMNDWLRQQYAYALAGGGGG